jgi:tetratricopeptide (TPR) repeat protein
MNKNARIVVLVLVAAVFSGCENNKYPSITYTNPVEVEDDFAKGANRPPTPDTLYRMARMLEAQGKDDQALAALTTAIERYPNYLPAYCGLAELHVRQRRLSDGMTMLEKARALAPEDPVVLNNIGMVFMLQGQYENALDAFAQAAGKAPDNARFKANMALATGMMGRYDEALALYTQVLRPARAHYNLSVIAEARNDMARANEEFAKASALDSTIERKPRSK